jgi:hypothetical protein
MSEALIAYVLVYRPYELIIDNWIEIINELTVMLTFMLS